jgi:hypothetical protein
MTDAYREALAAIDAGDLARLGAVLAAHPEVVRETVEDLSGHYAGYFAHATLLHHVAGNPIRGPLPANIVDVARLLLDAGADLRAPVGTERGGDLMGLVASSAVMATTGLYRPMTDLLLARGYSFDDDRGVLSVCLYHTVECQQQREVGEYLAARGAKVDLVFAAALGRPELVARFFAADAPTDEAYGDFRPDVAQRRARGAAALKQEALTWACLNGRQATVAQLLDLGADLDGRAEVAQMMLTPMHAAAWAGWSDTVGWLMDRGAVPDLIEPRWNNTPLGLAAWCRRENVVALLKRRLAGRLLLLDLMAVGDLPDIEAALAGKDVDEPPPGTTARRGVLLRDAAIYGRADTVRWLLAHGADRTLANPEGKTARDLALERGFTEVAALLA